MFNILLTQSKGTKFKRQKLFVFFFMEYPPAIWVSDVPQAQFGKHYLS